MTPIGGKGLFLKTPRRRGQCRKADDQSFFLKNLNLGEIQINKQPPGYGARGQPISSKI